MECSKYQYYWKNTSYQVLRLLSIALSLLPDAHSKGNNKTEKTIAFNFLWNGSERGKVKRSAMIADIDKGGIKFPDLDTIVKTQHICWIKRFFFSPPHPWKEIFTWQLNKINGIKVLQHTVYRDGCLSTSI